MKKISILFCLLLLKQFLFSQCLNGIYTIGGTTPSYTSVTQAVSSLTVNGVCGPVTFNIRPGTYTEKISISVVAGTSSVNTVVFQSENQDSTSVLMQAAGTSTANYVVNVNGADYIGFREMSFKNTSGSNMCVFLLGNGVLNFRLSNSVVDAVVPGNTISGASRYVVNSTGNSNYNFIMENCKVTGGQRGVYASSNSAINDFRLVNNIFNNQYEYGIWLGAIRNASVISNKVNYSLSNFSYLGMYLATATSSFVIAKNNFELGNGAPISLFSNSNSSGTNSQIINNRMNTQGTYGLAGLDMQSCNSVDIYHNTIVSASTNTSAPCFSINGLSNINIKNNIIYNKGQGAVYSLAGTLSSNVNITYDYNDIYTNGPLLAAYSGSVASTMSAWQTLGYDSHSLNYVPLFASTTDFHIATDFSQNLILPYFPIVSDDIEGTPRDHFSPYFGAYEYANPTNQNDASVARFVLNQNVCPGNGPLNIQLKNAGTNPLTSATINWSVNGALQTPVNWTGNIGFYDSLQVGLGMFNFADLGSYSLKAWTSLPNGLPDDYHPNDTVLIGNLGTALSGTYTIGGSSPTYTSAGAALSDIQVRGVCGNPVFNFRNGTYTASLLLIAVKGLSGNNSLTFQAESGVASDVTIASTTTLNTINFAGIENTVFKNLTIGSPLVQASVLRANTGSSNIEVSNCIIQGANNFNGIEGALATGNFNKLRILNNTFANCKYSINLTGFQNSTITYRYKNLKINGNTCSTYTNNCVAVTYADTMEFSGNHFVANSVTLPVQFSKFETVTYLLAAKNAINVNEAQIIYFGYSGGVINNNFFIGRGNSNGLFGVVVDHLDRMSFINNSVNCAYTGTASVALGHNYNGYYYYFRNNAIQNSGPGLAINLNESTIFTPKFKNNAYNSNGPSLVRFVGQSFQTDFQTISSWQSTFQTDTNSIDTSPLFTSDTDLHAHEILLKGAGTSIVNENFTDDIDGQARNTSAPDIGADEFVPFSLDGATNGMTIGGGNVCAGFFAPVQVILKNNGTTTLTSARLDCKINSTGLPSYNWTGSLAPGTQTLITVGSYSFSINSVYNIKAWSSLPNGAADIFHLNDTTFSTYNGASMSGLYTIGGASPNYTTIASAISDLKANGICGPVTFNIRNGVYNEQLKIPNIRGASALNTITFQSQSQDSSLVSIEYAPTTVNGSVVNTDSTDYVTFYKLGFKNLSTSTASYLMSFTNAAKHATIKNCQFTHNSSGNTLLYLENASDSALVTKNRFYRGQIAIFASVYVNMNIQKNYFIDQSGVSIYINGSGLDISSNEFNYTAIGTNCNAMTLSGNSNGNINANKIVYSAPNNSSAIYLEFSSDAYFLNITNNFISTNGSSPALYLQDVQNIRTINNSIRQNGSGTCVTYSNIYTSELKNNILYNQNGYCLSTDMYYPSFSTDYNCIYTLSNKLATVGTSSFTTLAGYVSAVMTGSNSISQDPLFVSATDLHASGVAVDGHGQYNPLVLTDIDGDVRNISTPDIGADEFQIIYSNVWPGDTDSSLIVDSQDLYSIGLQYGSSGYSRDSVSNLYIAQNSRNWNALQTNNTNMKFADCNGDGVVNMNDTLAINLNYNLPHLPKSPVAFSNNAVTNDIYMQYDKSHYLPGDTVLADIMLGSASNVKAHIYGVDFQLQFDEALVKSGSEKMLFTNSWIGTLNSTSIKFSKVDHNHGFADACLVRIVHTDVNGYGKIGTFRFILKDSINLDKMAIGIVNAGSVDHNGIKTPLLSSPDSVSIITNTTTTPTSIKTIASGEVRVYPNPAENYVSIDFKQEGRVSYELELVGADGKTIIRKAVNDDLYVLDLSDLSSGFYILKITEENKAGKMFKLIMK